MKKYILILFLFVCFNSNSQNRVTKENVKKVFTENRIEKQKGVYKLPSDKSWKFNNNDSLYFKQDTLTGIMNKFGKSKSLCKAVDWTFYKKNKFIKGSESICNEFAQRSVTRFPEDFFSITIYLIQGETIIDVLRNDKMIVESFKVISLETNNEFNKIILVRRFLPYN